MTHTSDWLALEEVAESSLTLTRFPKALIVAPHGACFELQSAFVAPITESRLDTQSHVRQILSPRMHMWAFLSYRDRLRRASNDFRADRMRTHVGSNPSNFELSFV